MSNDTWRRCSSCKSDIDFGSTYWVCNVSTCNRARTALYFCSVSCWEAHLPMMRHRESWAVEKTAPTRAAWAAEQEAEQKAEQKAEDTCLEALSTIVRDACNEAIRRAGADGRQTVMARDFRRY